MVSEIGIPEETVEDHEHVLQEEGHQMLNMDLPNLTTKN